MTRFTRRQLLGGLAALGAGALASRSATAAVQAIAQRHRLPIAHVAWTVLDIATGETLAEQPQTVLGPPASAAKLPAMIAALAILGPEHRFVTRLARAGDGLFLIGAGDPLLDSDMLVPLFDRAVAVGAGTRRLIGDVSALPSLDAIDPRQPLVATYNPGVSALTLNFNRMQLNWRRDDKGFRGSALGHSARLKTPIESVRVTTDPTLRVPYAPSVDATGEVWRVGTQANPTGGVFVPVRNPDRATLAIAARLLRERGLDLKPMSLGVTPPGAVEVARHESQALVETAALVLRYSNNLAADLIGLAAARRVDPAIATLDQAGALFAAWFRRRLPAVDWTGFRYANMSGLSTDTRITARQLAAITRLGAGLGRATLGQDLTTLLPAIEGRRDPRTGKRTAVPGVGDARAKGGTMAYARAMAGVFTTGGGRGCAFGVTVHDPALRARYDAALDPLVRGMSADARDWLDRAHDFEVELVAELRRTLA